MALSARHDMLRERSRLLGDMFSLMLRREALLLRLKYDPAQPRIPAGQPGGGRWAGEGEAAESDPEFLLAVGIDETDKHLTVEAFVSRKCKGGIYEVLPGEFMNMRIADVESLAEAGSAKA
jgi:hypothetical protein